MVLDQRIPVVKSGIAPPRVIYWGLYLLVLCYLYDWLLGRYHSEGRKLLKCSPCLSKAIARGLVVSWAAAYAFLLRIKGRKRIFNSCRKCCGKTHVAFAHQLRTQNGVLGFFSNSKSLHLVVVPPRFSSFILSIFITIGFPPWVQWATRFYLPFAASSSVYS